METIIDVHKPADYTVGGTFPNGTAYSTVMAYPSAPASESFEKESDSELSFKTPLKKRSFSAIKKAGVISMTAYENRNTEINNFVVGVPGKYVNIRRPNWWYNGACWYVHPQTDLVTSWTRQGDFRSWSKLFQYQPERFVRLNELPDVQSAIWTTQSAAVKKFLSGYDLLTELAEGRETLAFFGAVSKSAAGAMSKFLSEVDAKALERALKGNLSPQKLLRSTDRALRNLGSKWMAYRYAVMPLLYSFRDIQGLAKSDGLLFKSFRTKEVFEIEPPRLPAESDLLIYTRFYGTIEIRSTVKAGYSKSGLQSFVMSQLGFNPFATAYELIPLSFVFDWVVNMGEYIVSHTSQDFSQQSAMCTAVREAYTEEQVIYVNKTDTVSTTTGGAGNPCFPTPITLSHDLTYRAEGILRQRRVNDYRRFLFTAADVRLSLQSSMMNWKRYIDAAVLSHQNLKGLLTKVIKK